MTCNYETDYWSCTRCHNRLWDTSTTFRNRSGDTSFVPSPTQPHPRAPILPQCSRCQEEIKTVADFFHMIRLMVSAIAENCACHRLSARNTTNATITRSYKPRRDKSHTDALPGTPARSGNDGGNQNQIRAPLPQVFFRFLKQTSIHTMTTKPASARPAP